MVVLTAVSRVSGEPRTLKSPTSPELMKLIVFQTTGKILPRKVTATADETAS
jgi:hypothetical protein